MKINGGRGRQLNRPVPRMPSQSYKTYSIQQPVATHFRKASCAEVQCEAYLNGWVLRIDNLPPELQHTARHCGRSFKELDMGEDGGICLFYEAGQPCMAESTHRIGVDRPQLFIAGRGDWRTFSPRKAFQHKTPDDWAEDMSEHLDKIHTAIQRG